MLDPNPTTALIKVDDQLFAIQRDGYPRRVNQLLKNVLQNADQLVSLSIEDRNILDEVTNTLTNYCPTVTADPDTENTYDYTYTVTTRGVRVSHKNDNEQV